MQLDHRNITTLGALKESGWVSRSVKQEIRENITHKLKKGETLFPGILGYDKSVIPQFVNALLARHDIILLGLRGQGKSKMLRMLTSLLDEYLPEIEGSEINDDPFKPQSRYARDLVKEHGDDTPISWIHRSERYGEKLATPDTSVADLIGDIDPIKAAAEKLTLSNENVIKFGLIPHVNRGIFAINELPDLQPRIQVALLNIMQERDIQIRGFNIRFPLDVLIVFSANPEDYTNRGNIITPLKDRIDSQIITHYPRDIAIGKQITGLEAWTERTNVAIHIPEFMREIVEMVAFEARTSEYIDQKSGVSARLTITAMEQMVSSAERRALMNGEDETTLRITDLYHAVPALTGKLELVYEGEQEGAISVAKHIIGKAVNGVFKKHFPNPQQKKKEGEENPYAPLVGWFESGNSVALPDTLSETEYRQRLTDVDGLADLVSDHFEAEEGENGKLAAMDLVLEGLHQNSILGKEDTEDMRSYTDMLGSMLGGIDDFDDFDEGYEDIR